MMKLDLGNKAILQQLKKQAYIKFSGSENNIDKAKVILAYAHDLFDHNGNNQPSSLDPLTIIKEAKQGKQFRCVEYSLLAVALLWAYEIPARKIGLKTVDIETREYGAGHVVIEFWNKDISKWIMCDVQWGVIPKSGIEYLSVYELKGKIETHSEIRLETVSGSTLSEDKAIGYINWVTDYLFFLDTPVELTFDNIDLKAQQILMLVPKDVKSPVRFQNQFNMNAVYTNKLEEFYPSPD